MIEELYINDNYIELGEQTKIGLIQQVADIGDISGRNGDYTNAFNVPKTKNNQITLEYISSINSTSSIPYQNNTARYLQNGIIIVVNGSAIVKSFDEYYQIQVTYGNNTFFDLIKDWLLTDLDLSAWNHNYDLTTVLANEITTDGFCYPFVFWNKPNVLSPGRRLPMVFIKTLVEAIATKAGYTLSGSILSNIDYNSVLLSTNFRQSTAWMEDKINVSIHPNFDYNDTFSSAGGAVYGFHFPNIGYIVGNQYNVPETMQVDLSFFITINFGSIFHAGAQSAYDLFKVEIVELSTGAIIVSDVVNFSVSEVADIQSGVLVPKIFANGTGFMPVNNTQQYQIRMFGHTFATGNFYFAIESGSKYQSLVKDIIVPYGGSAIDFSKIMHNMKCYDFLKGVFNLLNIIPNENPFTKELNLTQHNDIQKNIPYAKDWSDKIDIRKTIITYSDSKIGQTNYIKYSNESDIADEYKHNSAFWKTVYGEHYLADNRILDPSFYGSGFILANNTQLDSVKDIIKLPFAASVLQTIPIVNADYSVDITTPRVMILTQVGSSSFATFDGWVPDTYGILRTLSFATYNPYASPVLRINDYDTIKLMFNNYKKVTIYAKLNMADISELDFSIPIYLNVQDAKVQLNGYFQINKINGYLPEKLTPIELIRI